MPHLSETRLGNPFQFASQSLGGVKFTAHPVGSYLVEENTFSADSALWGWGLRYKSRHCHAAILELTSVECQGLTDPCNLVPRTSSLNVLFGMPLLL